MLYLILAAVPYMENENCLHANFVSIGGTGGCHYDNLWCHNIDKFDIITTHWFHWIHIHCWKQLLFPCNWCIHSISQYFLFFWDEQFHAKISSACIYKVHDIFTGLVSVDFINTLWLRQNGRHFTDDIFRCIFVNEKFCILIKISLKFVPKGPTDNNPALV